jgi:hypothetical protein
MKLLYAWDLLNVAPEWSELRETHAECVRVERSGFLLSWRCREQRNIGCLERDSNLHFRVSRPPLISQCQNTMKLQCRLCRRIEIWSRTVSTLLELCSWQDIEGIGTCANCNASVIHASIPEGTIWTDIHHCRVCMVQEWIYCAASARNCVPHLVVSSTPLQKSITTLKNLLDHIFSTFRIAELLLLARVDFLKRLVSWRENSQNALVKYHVGFVQNLKGLEFWKQKFKALNYVLEFVKKYLKVLKFFLL